MERRKGNRKKMKIRVLVEPGSDLASTHDIDSQGAFVCTPRPLRLGMIVQLRLHLPSQTVKVNGTVRWNKKGRGHGLEEAKTGMAIQFSQPCLALQVLEEQRKKCHGE